MHTNFGHIRKVGCPVQGPYGRATTVHKIEDTSYPIIHLTNGYRALYERTGRVIALESVSHTALSLNNKSTNKKSSDH